MNQVVYRVFRASIGWYFLQRCAWLLDDNKSQLGQRIWYFLGVLVANIGLICSNVERVWMLHRSDKIVIINSIECACLFLNMCARMYIYIYIYFGMISRCMHPTKQRLSFFTFTSSQRATSIWICKLFFASVLLSNRLFKFCQDEFLRFDYGKYPFFSWWKPSKSHGFSLFFLFKVIGLRVLITTSPNLHTRWSIQSNFIPNKIR